MSRRGKQRGPAAPAAVAPTLRRGRPAQHRHHFRLCTGSASSRTAVHTLLAETRRHRRRTAGAAAAAASRAAAVPVDEPQPDPWANQIAATRVLWCPR
jgi:hypothetical protein